MYRVDIIHNLSDIATMHARIGWQNLRTSEFLDNGLKYKYRFEISGRMPNAAVDSTFVYLSNLESISFEQAWKAAGLSSNTADYFAVEDAILVDWVQTIVEYDEAYAPTD